MPPPPMAEWPQIMEGNIAHTLDDRNIFNGCYANDLQRRIVLMLGLVTYNRVITKKVARILGVKLASQKFCVRPWSYRS